MSQNDVYEILKNNPTSKYTTKQLSEKLKINMTSASNNCKILIKRNEIEMTRIKLDRHKTSIPHYHIKKGEEI